MRIGVLNTMKKVIVSENEKDLKRLDARILCLNNWAQETKHGYENHEAVYYVTSGYGTLTFHVGPTEKKFQIYSGEYIWMPKGINHGFVNLGEGALRLVCFTCKTT
jgi:mannose-6-phosphate isomerase-like protein (cupin superfamily)